MIRRSPIGRQIVFHFCVPLHPLKGSISLENNTSGRLPDRYKSEDPPLTDELLRLYRERSRFTQSELAALLGFAGDRTIRKWEGSFTLPTPKHLKKLIELYLARGVFLTGQEYAEAHQLWTIVKDFFESGVNKAKEFPPFDTNWFSGLAKPLSVSQISLPASFPNNEQIHNLPAPVTSFIGRKTELIEIKQYLQNSRLLTLTGTGGIGKTRLALRLALEMVSAFRHGVYLVELAGLTTSEQLIQGVADVVGVKETARQPLVTSLVNFLKSRELLLVLDNCEHLINYCAALVTQLLSYCPALKILATSRERLGIPGEIAWRVPPLSLPEVSTGELQEGSQAQDVPGAVTGSDAVELLVDRVRAVRTDFELNSLNTASVNELCQHLEGLPLAIELAATRARILSIEQITSRLSERFRLLAGNNMAVEPRQKTLQALIDWSFELLDENEQNLFTRLAVFAGGFTLEAAEVVCSRNEDNTEAGEIPRLLSELIAKSLVSTRQSEGVKRYSLLETLRIYGQDKLIARGEELFWREKHLRFYFDFAARHEPGLNTGSQKENVELVGHEYLNCQTALNFAISRQDQKASTALQMCQNLITYWEIRSYFSEGKSFVERSLALPDASSNIIDRARALISLSWLNEQLGEYELGIEQAGQSLKIGQETGNNEIISGSLNSLGNLNSWLGNNQLAKDYYTRVLALHQKMGNEMGISTTLLNLGLVAIGQSDFELASNYYMASLVISKKLGNDHTTAGSLNSMGLISDYQGNYEQARAYYEESLKIARELGNRKLVAINQTNLGVVAVNLGDYDSARAYYCESLPLHEALGSKLNASNVLINLGELDRIRGAYEAARDYMNKALQLKEEIGNKWGQAICLNNLGNIFTNLGDYEKARGYCQESLTLRQELDNKQGIASCYSNLGNIALLEGDYDLALLNYRQNLTLQRQFKDHSGILSGLAKVALVNARQGKLDEAQQLFPEILQMLPLTQNKLTLASLVATVAVIWDRKPKTPENEVVTAQLVKTVEILLTSSKAVLERVYLQPFFEVKLKLAVKFDFKGPDNPLLEEKEITGLLQRAVNKESN